MCLLGAMNRGVGGKEVVELGVYVVLHRQVLICVLNDCFL